MGKRGSQSRTAVAGAFPTPEWAFSVSALHRAMLRALRGHRSDREAAVFLLQRDRWLCQLSDDLLAGTWSPGPYREFWVHDSKPRKVAELDFADRVVHHALIAAVEPGVDPLLDRNSYACRRGMGLHRCIMQAQGYMRSNRYALAIDIQHYFQEVSHDILIDILLSFEVPDEFCTIFRKCMVAQSRTAVENRQESDHSPGKGMCIGALTSQFLGNLGLHPIEQALRSEFRECDHVRYMDDIVVFGSNKRTLWTVHDRIEQVANGLGLNLKSSATRLAPVTEGLTFCGYRVFPSRLLLRPTAQVRLERLVRRTERARLAGSLSDADAFASIGTRLLHASHADTLEWRKDLVKRLWPW